MSRVDTSEVIILSRACVHVQPRLAALPSQLRYFFTICLVATLIPPNTDKRTNLHFRQACCRRLFTGCTRPNAAGAVPQDSWRGQRGCASSGCCTRRRQCRPCLGVEHRRRRDASTVPQDSRSAARVAALEPSLTTATVRFILQLEVCCVAHAHFDHCLAQRPTFSKSTFCVLTQSTKNGQRETFLVHYCKDICAFHTSHIFRSCLTCLPDKVLPM
jgi:hypothetical protein